jgi:hypothetical protein
MLSTLKESGTRVTGRAALILVCLALGALAIPTVKWASGAAGGGLSNSDNAKSLVFLVDDRPSDKSADGAEPAKGESESTAEYFPLPTTAERKILEALEKPVDAEFHEMPLKACLEALELQAKIDFWLDKGKFAEEGLALDRPVTLRLKGRRLDSVLNLLLTPIGVTYLYEDEVLKITTSQSAGDTLITRTYPVGDLLEWTSRRIGLGGGMGMGGGVSGRGGGGAGQPDENVPTKESDPPTNSGSKTEQQSKGRILDFNSLMNAIETTIQPDSWEALSGPGSMMPARVAHSLVVRQTWAVHRQVLQLLRDLRATKRLKREIPDRASPIAN